METESPNQVPAMLGFWGQSVTDLLYPHMTENARELFGVSTYKMELIHF